MVGGNVHNQASAIECRKHAPVPGTVTGSGQGWGRWPIVKRDDACGDFALPPQKSGNVPRPSPIPPIAPPPAPSNVDRDIA